MEKSSREIILSAIKAASSGQAVADNFHIHNEVAIYKPVDNDRVHCFKNELEAINGKCIVASNEKELFRALEVFCLENGLLPLFCHDDKLVKLLLKYNISFTSDEKDFLAMTSGLTKCEFLIARTGSVVVSSQSSEDRRMNIFPPVHLIFAHSSQIVDFVEDAMKGMQTKYSDQLPSTITTITGPSRTADIEKTLVLGAHGPKELVVFLVKD